jgi:hypothetical protein
VAREYLYWGLIGAAALYALSRTQRGAEVAADVVGGTVETVGEVVVTARRLAMPRGVRNNNPGNLRPSGAKWQGLATPSDDGQYLVFTDAFYGLRALARNLVTYSKRGKNTVRDIINTWAPPRGVDLNGRPYSQDTEAYIRAVARRLNVNPDAPFVVAQNLEPLTRAIVAHENGAQWEHHYSADTYARAIRSALS